VTRLLPAVRFRSIFFSRIIHSRCVHLLLSSLNQFTSVDRMVLVVTAVEFHLSCKKLSSSLLWECITCNCVYIVTAGL